ncbi:MAG: NUDIX hydrolase [bacterium]
MDEKMELVCSSCGFVFYQNPRPAVAAIIADGEGKIMLVRRAMEPKKGEWDVPGGFVDWGESPEHAMARELREELGIRFASPILHGIYHDWYDWKGMRLSILNIYYSGTCSGNPRPASDVSEIKWFSPDALPSAIAFDHIRRAIADLRLSQLKTV